MSVKLTQDEFETRFYNKFDKDEWLVVGPYVKNNVPIKIRHVPCGTEFEGLWGNIQKRGCNCPLCKPSSHTNLVIVGVNDMATTNPALAALLNDPDDAYKYREHSNKVVAFKCPNCGKIHNKPID